MESCMISFSYSVVQVIENDNVLRSVTLGGAWMLDERIFAFLVKRCCRV
jgi:hypothetical protein